MTVRKLFNAAADLLYDDVITITHKGKVLYKGAFIDVLMTVYAEYSVWTFSQEKMYIEVL